MSASPSVDSPRSWPPLAVDRAAIHRAITSDGYFALAPVVPTELVAACHAAIAACRAADVPTVGAFAFDAPWELAALLAPIAEAGLAGPAWRLPALWAWWIGDGGEPGGWPPHRDNPERPLADDGTPASLTVWVAVSDATADNGCMYLVPAPWDVQYRNPAATNDVLSLQTIRAVPAAAGAVLGWTSRVLHWGGWARPGAPPRLSISIEYQRAEPPYFDGAAAPLDQIPHGRDRADLITQMWDRYRHAHDETDQHRRALATFVEHTLGI